MTSKDIFASRTWNFLQGDRHIESILRDLSPQHTLVLRNQWRHVMATLAGIRDLSALGWSEDGFIGGLKVPENALIAPSESGDCTPQEWIKTWLGGYGIRWQEKVGHGEVLLVIHPCESLINQAESQVLENLLKALPLYKSVIFVLPRGHTLHPALKPWAKKSSLALYFNGLNAFTHPSLEEVLGEINPQTMTLGGFHPETVAYTAIGAADFYITHDAQFRNPQALSLGDLLGFGNKVSILAGATRWRGGKAVPFKTFLQAHFSQVLGVQDLSPDYRFQASREAIAIDIV